MTTTEAPLWSETPLIYSSHISARLGCNVYLKLENLHPSHSFKYRGISHFIQDALRKHGPGVHLVIASGGNAGLAAACAAHVLKLRCTVFLPIGVSREIHVFMCRMGAEVVEEGKVYLDALGKAEETVQADPEAVMVPAYDDALLWEGHGSMISEIARQLPPGTKPDAFFCSVGGGGLVGGVFHGCKANNWDDVPVIALETHGSNCFHESLALNSPLFPAQGAPTLDGRQVLYDATHDVKTAQLASLSSRATSLNASSPAPGVVKTALTRAGSVRAVAIPDELAMQAALSFAEEHKLLVELACAATLAPAYTPALFAKLVPPAVGANAPRTVVFVVCGGFKISVAELAEYRALVAADAGAQWRVVCNGEEWGVDKS